MNLMASLPDIDYDDGGDEEEDGMMRGEGLERGSVVDGSVVVQVSHRTIPETPSASPLLIAAQPMVADGGHHGGGARRLVPGVGPGRMVDNSPSKRAQKSIRTMDGGWVGGWLNPK